MKTICAWCQTFDPHDPANRGASHGICPRCAAKFERDVARVERDRLIFDAMKRIVRSAPEKKS